MGTSFVEGEMYAACFLAALIGQACTSETNTGTGNSSVNRDASAVHAVSHDAGGNTAQNPPQSGRQGPGGSGNMAGSRPMVSSDAGGDATDAGMNPSRAADGSDRAKPVRICSGVGSNGDAVSQLLVDEKNVYALTGTELVSCPLGGGKPNVLLSGFYSGGQIATDGKMIYLLSSRGGSYSIVSVPRDGGTVTMLNGASAIRDAPDFSPSMVTDGKKLYLATCYAPNDQPRTQVLSLAVGGDDLELLGFSGPISQVNPCQPHLSDITTDGKNVYFLRQDDANDSFTHSLLSVAVNSAGDAGASTVLVSGVKGRIETGLISDSKTFYLGVFSDYPAGITSGAQNGNGVLEVLALPQAGGTASIVWSNEHQMYPVFPSLNLEGDALYLGSGKMDLVRISTNGSGQVSILPESVYGTTFAVAFDRSSVYYVNGLELAIYRMPLPQ
jgi:hypothetical protein